MFFEFLFYNENMEKADRILRFYYKVIYAFKKLERAGWSKYWGVPSEKSESVAEHIFAVAFLAVFLNKEFDLGLDIGRVLELALVHELDELIIGDVPARDRKAVNEKEAQKEAARAKIAELLDGLYSKEYLLALFDEAENAQTPEAKFVREIDKLEFSLQGYAYCKDGVGDTCNGEKLVEYTEPTIQNSDLLKIVSLIKNLK